MTDLETLTYEVTGRVARITLNRPERGNGLTRDLITELERAVERADLDPAVHVLLLSGNGKGFCGGYDLVESAEGKWSAEDGGGSALDPAVIAANHNPADVWDPMVDYAMMSRNVRSFMALFHCTKPVVCKVHGFCVAGGTDLALCSDLLVIAADAKIGYPPARVWGSPTTSLWASRLGPQRARSATSCNTATAASSQTGAVCNAAANASRRPASSATRTAAATIGAPTASARRPATRCS